MKNESYNSTGDVSYEMDNDGKVFPITNSEEYNMLKFLYEAKKHWDNEFKKIITEAIAKRSENAYFNESDLDKKVLELISKFGG